MTHYKCTTTTTTTITTTTTTTLPYTVALWNKTTNVSDEITSAIPDDDAKANTDTKTEVTLNESDTKMPVCGVSKYPDVILPSNKHPAFVAAVVNLDDFYVQLAEQEADLAELITSLSAKYNSPVSDRLVLVDPKRGGKCVVPSSTDEQWQRALRQSRS